MNIASIDIAPATAAPAAAPALTLFTPAPKKRIRKPVEVAVKRKGLWVGRQPKRKIPARDLSLVPADKRPWDVFPDAYFPDYYLRLTRGKEPVIKKCLGTPDFKVAIKRALVEWQIWDQAQWNERAAALLKKPDSIPTTGEVIDAFERVFPNSPRVAGSLRLIYAQVKGLVPKRDKRNRKFQIFKGSDIDLKIRALPITTTCDPDIVEAYFTQRQGGTYNPTLEHEDHASINGTFEAAKALFSVEALRLCYRHLKLPDLTPFTTFPKLYETQPDPSKKEITAANWEAMYLAAEKLLASDDVREREIGFANWVLRLTALRGCELLNAKIDWIEERVKDGVTTAYLVIQAQPDQPYVGKAAKNDGKVHYTPKSRKHVGAIPLDPKLWEYIKAKDLRGTEDRFGTKGPDGYLFYPSGSRTARCELLKKGHNAFVKPLLGKEDLDQGNHLLRAYVATFIASKYDSDKKAGTYLRHSVRKEQEGQRESISQRYYISKQFADLPIVTDADILAWGKRHDAAE